MSDKWIKIVTSTGTFNADTIMAIAIIKLLYKDKVIIKRTDNINDMNAADMVIGTGKINNPTIDRYDYLNVKADDKRDNGIPLLNCGHVWETHQRRAYYDEVSQMVDDNLISAIEIGAAKASGELTFDDIAKYNKTLFYNIYETINSYNNKSMYMFSRNKKLKRDYGFNRAICFAESVLNDELVRCKSLIQI